MQRARAVGVLLCTVLGLVGSFSAAACARPEKTGRLARVVWIHDGDTVTVRIGEQKDKVRMIGIDTPELGDRRRIWKDLAYEARDHLIRDLKGRAVTLKSDPLCSDRDAYGRLLRYVILEDGTNVNEEMIRRGFARAFTRFPFTLSERFLRVEGDAREAGAGRWGEAYRGEP